MAASDEAPGGLVNYALAMQGAEEIASYIVDKIVSDGGLKLYQKYVERKCLVYAREATTEQLMTYLDACFVPFDNGEAEQDDVGHGWEIEEEPMPTPIDSQAAYFLEIKAKQPRQPMLSAADKERRRLQQLERVRLKAMHAKPKKEKKEEQRNVRRDFPLADIAEPDEEAERYRQMKADEKRKAEEKLKADRIKALEREKEQRRIDQLHEQMENNPHTWDHNGVLMWVDVPKPEKLPAVQAFSPWRLKADHSRSKREEIAQTALNASGGAATTSQSQTQQKSRNAKDIGRNANRKRQPSKGQIEATHYTDAFAPLKGGQPDMIETMQMQSGVTLDMKGRHKSGGPLSGDTMSRREYVVLAEHEISGGRPGSRGGAYEAYEADVETSIPMAKLGGDAAAASSAAAGGGRAPGGASAGGGGGGGAAGGGGGGGGVGGGGGGANFGAGLDGGGGGVGEADAEGGGAGGGAGGAAPQGGGGAAVGAGGFLPAIDKGRGPPAAAGGGPPPGGGAGSRLQGTGVGPMPGEEGSRRTSIKTAPKAPPPGRRSQAKYDALGWRPKQPRFHQPVLGGQYAQSGVAQPPIGATMGHGIHHGGAQRGSFFFPPWEEQEPVPHRSQSEVQLHRFSPSGGDVPMLQHSPSAGAIRPTSGGGFSPGPASVGFDEDDNSVGVLHIDRQSAAYNMLLKAAGT